MEFCMDGFCQPQGANHSWSSADKIWPLKQRKLISGPRAEELGPALANQLSSRQAPGNLPSTAPGNKTANNWITAT